jgi:preprotein translocase subunit SecE
MEWRNYRLSAVPRPYGRGAFVQIEAVPVIRSSDSRQQGAGMNKIVQFFKDSYGELKKVVWPSRENVIASTKVVVVSTLMVAVFLGLVDFLLVRGIDFFF